MSNLNVVCFRRSKKKRIQQKMFRNNIKTKYKRKVLRGNIKY
jgi:hypothetical protein